MPLDDGSQAPPIPGTDLARPATVAFFYKVTCPVCEMAGPKVAAFDPAYPGVAVGVGQDPPERLDRFSRERGLGFASVADLPPYEISSAYGIQVVPTTILIGEGRVLRTVESWDRDGLNELSRQVARITGAEYVEVSNPADGLPAFRPG
jgi:peroxiredoxin